MIQPPITEQELPRLYSDLADLMHQAHEYYETVRMTPFADLASKHITWLALYQVGEEISHLAERLDSTYQAQFQDESAEDQHVRISHRIRVSDLWPPADRRRPASDGGG